VEPAGTGGLELMALPVAHIDLNIRAGKDGQETFIGMEDIHGAQRPIQRGDEVIVLEPESGVEGRGWVTTINEKINLVYLRVDWRGLR
jgi:hypothetical protein